MRVFEVMRPENNEFILFYVLVLRTIYVMFEDISKKLYPGIFFCGLTGVSGEYSENFCVVLFLA
jgi:hypothetical protein